MPSAFGLEELFGEGLVAACHKRTSLAAAVLDSAGWVKLAVFSYSLDLERQLIQKLA